MTRTSQDTRQRDLILGLTPLSNPDTRLAIAVATAGGLGVVDLGRERERALEALAVLQDSGAGPFGVALNSDTRLTPADLPPCIDTVVVEAGARIDAWKPRRVLVQCVSLEEALVAVRDGAEGIIAKGAESGGRVGDESAFVLLQRLTKAIDLPVWVQGGIGLYTAGACIAAGARGIVLDAQLALLEESGLEGDARSAIASMDGSETAVVDGQRLLVQPMATPRATAELTGPGHEEAGAGALAVGQDGAFAHHFASRYKTVLRLLSALRASITESIRSAQEEAPLRAFSGFAREHSLRYPIVQGPMTRVSDTPDFAEAIAEGGALPFLALALMRGPEVRKLLGETAARMGDRTWGVGILGFVPPELREEQMEVIREVKPPVALIAGGRPSQARPLEELGIPTYLHVPSPGLLDMFLKQGARRFVFEGQECGGHIGPRTSFVLWESQIQRLMEHDAPWELSVIFAGGIHDALSAAMVATIAAPLARRGAKVAVLMGTAYLFTQEATASGAIKQGFQDVALACDSTVLLETAPGHATRCADTDYVETFRSERERMLREGVPQQETWEALEMLNVGRLRIASKGLNREGDRIVEVDDETQRREGMVMLGQVAVMRDGLTTVPALHEDVSEGATRFLDALDAREYTGQTREEDIAIVGMAAIMPQAPETADFWSNIVRGVDCITEIPRERWNPDIFFDPDSKDGEKTPSKWGGFIDPVAFDPLLYGIPPFSLAAIEPVQLLALEASRRALADAGYLERYFDRQRTSVIFGAEAGSDLSSAYGFRALWRQYVGEIPPELDAVLPTMTEDSFAGILSNVISGRIANRLDLGGVNYTVDAACAASLAAINLAMKELAGGTSDMVICGGADLHNGIVDYLAFSSVHALGQSGRCRTFDASADGITLGEGVAAMVLKRLSDAERDGDRIYAVLKAVGGASDGKSLGLTAPRAEGQVRTLERAYRQAGVSPAEVALVEAHGTGTVVGDRTELESLDLVFRRENVPAGEITLGSVKSQIGHTKCTAGIAGLIKVALSLYNRVLPATLHITDPNPGWDPTSPFSLNTSARPWPGSKRKAGVSAFGFGGTNFHAVVEEYETKSKGSGYDVWPSELFLFRGRDTREAQARIEELTQLLARDEHWRLRDLARSTSAGSDPVRVAVVASDVEDLRAKLTKAAGLQADPAGVFIAPNAQEPRGRVAFLYPGQGSQGVSMLRDLFITFPRLQRYLELAPDVAKVMFPPTAWDDETREAQRVAITDTRAAQPALGIGGLAATDLLANLSIHPDMVAGHSYGELAALQAAGVYSAPRLIHLSAVRAKCILDAASAAEDNGAMAAVGAAPADIEPHIAGIDGVVMANQNAPGQTVISGTTGAVAEAAQRLAAVGFTVRSLDVACAFHSPVVAAAADTFLEALKQVDVRPPTIKVFSNTGGEPFPKEQDKIRERLARQIAEPVQFHQEVEAMYAAGARIFVEAGPGRVLTGLASRILGERPHVAVALDAGGQHGVTQLLKALAQLAVAGVEFDAERLYDGRDARLFELQDAPSSRPAATSWWVNGQRAWPVSQQPPPHAMVPVREPLPIAIGGASDNGSVPAVAAGREAVVLEYLRSVRELVDTQRRVMLGYLGTDPGPLPAYPSLESSYPANGGSLPGTNGNGHQVIETSWKEVPAPVAQQGPKPAHIDVAGALLAIISDRTGYPVEMLGLDLDMEADLSIDSIKRIEILGALAEKLGLSSQAALEDLPDDLVRKKTLQEVLDALTVLIPRGAPAAPAPLAVGVELTQGNGHVPVAAGNGHGPVLDTRTALLDVVSSRTGYPVEMLDLELNLEADLSIDSIKRIEILGALAEKLGLNAQTAFEAIPDELVRVKTLQGIIDAFTALASRPGAGDGQHSLAAGDPPPPQDARPTSRVPRYVPAEKPSELGAATVDLAGKSVAVLGDSEARSLLAARLAASGARVLEHKDEAEKAQVLIELSPLSPGWQPAGLVSLFGRLRDALVGGVERVIVAADKAASGGIAGMVRTLGKEWPDRVVRAVVLDSLASQAQADCMFAEVCAAEGPAVVRYSDAGRFETTSVRRDIAAGGAPSLELDKSSVVLITGGARGIAARIAGELASRFHCCIELVGRTPEPAQEEEPDIAAAPDLPSLRRALIARGELREPAAIEAACTSIMAAREVRRTLHGLRDAGSSVAYHVADVRDAEALGRVIDDVYQRHGRIDVVIHAAGVIEDKLAVDKTLDSFSRVLETKVAGANTLAERLGDDVKAIVFFSSVSGAFGNRGQVDYATANGYLDWLASEMNVRCPGRVVSVAWGPWADGGMVSPELARQYSARGVELIEPEAGVDAFMTELLAGPADDAHVLLMRAFPSALA